MPRPSSEMLTDREAQIMEILWELREATAEQVRARLPDNPHDSTVRTLLRVLKDKGYVRTRGRQPAVYLPLVAKEVAQHTAARRLIDRFFGGSANELVLRLLEDDRLSLEQIEQLKNRYLSERPPGDPS
jgi:BlaI family transcriptional regulator, penicillinase repressor